MGISQHYTKLKEKWQKKNSDLRTSLNQKHSGVLEWVTTHAKHATAVGSASALMFLSTPAAITNPPAPQPDTSHESPFRDVAGTVFLVSDLSHEIPDIVSPLTSNQEFVISQTLSRHFGIFVTPELQGIRLNRSYGFIGLEQHLARWPGDNVENMAPGRGAWGYFTDKNDTNTSQAVEREKWYIAVQTFLAPGYNENVKKYSDFLRFRKMIVINPENGKAVIADIGDAGPSPWTGKSVGGSPDVMQYLERVDGAQRGPVLYFFIDDPDNSIPLGPISPQQ